MALLPAAEERLALVPKETSGWHTIASTIPGKRETQV